MKWSTATFLEAIRFAKDREIEHDDWDGTVHFTDGTALRVSTTPGAFGGSDVTPPDPDEVLVEVGQPL